MNLEIQQHKKRLENLKSFLDQSEFTEEEIVAWVSDCVGFFSVIGVSEIIIQGFLKVFENHLITEKVESFNLETIGGLSENGVLKVFYFGPFQRFSSSSRYTKGLFDNKNFLYLRVALKTAEDIIDKIENLENIIPKTLINVFNDTSLENIKNTLEVINLKYKSKDTRGMISPLITVTQSILNLIPEISEEKKISKQILTMYSSPTLQEKYSLNRDVLWGLNAARIIRNEEVEHQKKEHEGSLSFMEIVGYAHLFVLFANSLFASGNVDL